MGRFILVLVLGLVVNLLGGCASMDTKASTLSGKKILVHGHRGSRGTHPENTMPAFKEAFAAKADVLELDMHLSKDDIIFVSHDPTIPAALFLDPKGKKIKKAPLLRHLTAEEIKGYTCGHVVNEKFPTQAHMDKVRMPMLDEVFRYVTEEAPQLELNIETKMDGPPSEIPDPAHFVKLVLELINKYHLRDRVILQSFDFRTLEAAKRLDPALRRSCLFENEKNYDELTIKAGCQIASPFYELVTSKNVKNLHEHGIQVVPWTPNKPEQWKQLIHAGVDAIITDYPRQLVEYLKK